ncbi:hypothetical protein AOLI_G00053570 [Acnodon oligacanthus]
MVTFSATEAQLQIMARQWSRKRICSEQGSAEAGCRRRSEGNIVEEEEGCGLDLLMEKRMELLLTARLLEGLSREEKKQMINHCEIKALFKMD